MFSKIRTITILAVATLTVFHTAHFKLLLGSHLSELRQKNRGPVTDCDADLAETGDFLPEWQRRGIAGRLLDYLRQAVTTPRLLVGTWAGAVWAIAFWEKNGFGLVPDKDELLQRYWDIPPRQIEASVVLGIKLR